jgi:hypothetical protein
MIIKSATNETISIRRVIISLRRYKRKSIAQQQFDDREGNQAATR